jgi:hypothetical protein
VPIDPAGALVVNLLFSYKSTNTDAKALSAEFICNHEGVAVDGRYARVLRQEQRVR